VISDAGLAGDPALERGTIRIALEPAGQIEMNPATHVVVQHLPASTRSRYPSRGHRAEIQNSAWLGALNFCSVQDSATNMSSAAPFGTM
jgi:hypothetical protein